MSRHIAHVTLIEVIHVLASRYPDFVENCNFGIRLDADDPPLLRLLREPLLMGKQSRGGLYEETFGG